MALVWPLVLATTQNPSGWTQIKSFGQAAQSYGHYFSASFFGILPTGLQRHSLEIAKDWSIWTKLLLAAEAIVLVTLATLFIMAIRRRFKR